MYYKIPENEFYELIKDVYLKGRFCRDSANTIAEEIVRKYKNTHDWDIVPDMMSTDSEENYTKEMEI